MHPLLRSVVVVLLGVALAAVVTAAEPSLSRFDANGPVSVVVTPTAAPVAGVPLTVKVVLNTHSVGLDGVDFAQAVVMRTTDDREVAPRVETVTGRGHHRQAVLVFPAPKAGGPVRLVVKNVGGVAERTFVWETAGR